MPSGIPEKHIGLKAAVAKHMEALRQSVDAKPVVLETMACEQIVAALGRDELRAKCLRSDNPAPVSISSECWRLDTFAAGLLLGTSIKAEKLPLGDVKPTWEEFDGLTPFVEERAFRSWSLTTTGGRVSLRSSPQKLIARAAIEGVFGPSVPDQTQLTNADLIQRVSKFIESMPHKPRAPSEDTILRAAGRSK